MKEKIFVIGTARSGTTQIAKILSGILNIKLFPNEKILKFAKSCAESENEISKREIINEIDNLINNKLIKEIYVGPNLEISKILEQAVKYLFYKKEILIVRTFRKNKLKQALSSEIALRTGVWHKNKKEDYDSLLKKIKPIPINDIKNRINQLKHLDNCLDSHLSDVEHIRIEYEKFYFEKEEFKNKIEKILERLGSEIETKSFLKLCFELEKAKTIIKFMQNTKLNSSDSYYFIPNIMEIKKELSNEENGFL